MMELQIRNISKTYRNDVQALKNVTLTIPAGMYGLLCPNGAGKSTLMRILATLQEPDRGSIRLGDTDVLNHALRRMLEKHRPAEVPLATTLELYRELEVVTPDSRQYLLHDLFGVNTFWQLKTEQATAVETEAGFWQVTLDVRGHKMVVDEAGVETEVPMDDWVEIGVFAPAEEGEEAGEPLYVQMHRIRSGTQRITVTVTHKPAHVGIDPQYLLIDSEIDDNTAEVKIER